MSYDQEDTLATLKMRALEESDLGVYRYLVQFISHQNLFGQPKSEYSMTIGHKLKASR